MTDFLTAVEALWVYCLLLVVLSALVLWIEQRERRAARAAESRARRRTARAS